MYIIMYLCTLMHSLFYKGEGELWLTHAKGSSNPTLSVIPTNEMLACETAAAKYSSLSQIPSSSNPNYMSISSQLDEVIRIIT